MANNNGRKITFLRPQRHQSTQKPRRTQSSAPRGIVQAPRGIVNAHRGIVRNHRGIVQAPRGIMHNYSRPPSDRTLYHANPASLSRRQHNHQQQHLQQRKKNKVAENPNYSHNDVQKRPTKRHIQKQARAEKQPTPIPAVRLIQPSRFQIQQQQHQQQIPRENSASTFVAASPISVAIPKTSSNSVRPTRLVSPPPKFEFSTEFSKLVRFMCRLRLKCPFFLLLVSYLVFYRTKQYIKMNQRNKYIGVNSNQKPFTRNAIYKTFYSDLCAIYIHN